MEGPQASEARGRSFGMGVGQGQGCRGSRASRELRRVWDLAVGVGYQRREGPTGGAKKGLLGGTRVKPG